MPAKQATTRSRAERLAAQVKAAFGDDAVMMGSDPYFEVEYVPTGVMPIDHLLSGGIPRGRFVEIFGDYSTLKSYIALKAIATWQKRGYLCALIDTEHSYDRAWAREIGVNTEELVLKQPETAEKAVDLCEILLRGGVDLIVYDSVAAALPKQEQEDTIEKEKVAPQARLMSRAMRKLTAANKKSSIIWINQTRVNVGVMFGSNESVPGGKSLPFYASYRVAVRKSGKITEDVEIYVGGVKKKVKQTVAQQIRATLEKSKLNAPHHEVWFEFNFRNVGVDNWSYLANLALEHGVVGFQKGYWWLTDDRKKKKYRQSSFRGAISEKELLWRLAEKMPALAQVDSSVLNGNDQLVKKKAVKLKNKNSKSEERDSTRDQVQGVSKKTVRIKRPFTK